MKSCYSNLLSFAFFLCACGQEGVNRSDKASMRSSKDQIVSFEASWTIGNSDPNCVRTYKSSYQRSTAQGAYAVGCARFGNLSVIEQELINKEVRPTDKQTTAIDTACNNLDLTTLKERYERTDHMADGVTLGLTFYTDSSTKYISVDASSTIPSLQLVEFLNAIDATGLIDDSGYPQ